MEWRSEAKGSGVFLHGPDIEIMVKASNEIPTFSRKTLFDYFGISLLFDPKQAGFKFNPKEVSLFLPEMGELRPWSINLKVSGGGPGYAGWECGNYSAVDAKLGPSYALHRDFCVELYFAMKPPSPDTQFKMRIRGLMYHGEPIRVPELHFHRAPTAYDFFDFPAL